MFGLLFRLLARFIILIPGLVISYFVVTEIYPSIGRRTPVALTVLITYVLTAYLLIPFGFRLVRFVIKPKHIPLYTTSPDGLAMDPVNVGLIGTKKQITKAMAKAGWYHADDHNLKNVIREIWSVLTNRPYPTAPFSTLYLFGRGQDMGFQLPAGTNPSQRHHVRFWAATYDVSEEFRDHTTFWQKFHKSAKSSSRILWVGASSLDTGLGIIRHNAQFTHMIHPDTNAERDLLVRDLKQTGMVAKTRTVKIGEPRYTNNRVWTSYMHADGKITICELR